MYSNITQDPISTTDLMLTVLPANIQTLDHRIKTQDILLQIGIRTTRRTISKVGSREIQEVGIVKTTETHRALISHGLAKTLAVGEVLLDLRLEGQPLIIGKPSLSGLEATR